jgi:hypothetical protein
METDMADTRPANRGRKTESALLDRRYFTLDAETFERFIAMLDPPARGESQASSSPCREGTLGAMSGERRSAQRRRYAPLTPLSCGFQPLTVDPMMLMITLPDVCVDGEIRSQAL